MSEDKLRILVTDDHEVTRLSFSRVLDHLGYACDFAVDGNECLVKMAEHRYDVVFLDLVMPGMDGEHVLRQLVDKYPVTDVVVASVQDDEDIIRNLLEHGATAYLIKPFTIESIEDVVGQLEKKRKKQRENREKNSA